MTIVFLYALVAVTAGTAAGLGVYIRRSGRLARLFLALPKGVRRDLLRNPALLRLDGETRHITYLSCRIANAAEMEQALRGHPARLIRLFERQLGALTEAALEQGGTVERFGSTGFAAYWNAPLNVSDPAGRAVAAAVQMLKVAREQTLLPRRDPIPATPMQLAIGLASGPAVAGLFGGAYSVSGACVLRAEELRDSCEGYGFSALSDAETAEAAANYALLKVDRPAAGTDETAAIYALLGDAGIRASPTFRALSTYHDRIFAALDAQEHEEARRLIAQASALSGASRKLYDLIAARDLRMPLKQAS